MTMHDLDRQQSAAAAQPAFAHFLGFRLISANPDEVMAVMEATAELSNRNGVLHGGAILGFADNLGGTAATINLGPGQATTTMESKTNFLRPIRIGDVARGRCVALHKGRTTMIWQSTITRGDGKVAAIVTQTQMVMEWRERAATGA
ncbi:MAG TPA: PaaI family thioesterase [Paracoccus sp. (in: a-proteobacteria)]|uniref:PaaI family thioesterase n=1 Tax=Paracoccus sp. TaxID=267 RepID=UPI002C0928B9|nr:PaaI family thioesterase [Paracoccus sp. (in: a-proteobacteria)]HWL56201.1 PaaI family thioesterase [Paracoccus sp. (in: a-proteobacteria)]